jgi:hypothetical protein
VPFSFEIVGSSTQKLNAESILLASTSSNMLDGNPIVACDAFILSPSESIFRFTSNSWLIPKLEPLVERSIVAASVKPKFIKNITKMSDIKYVLNTKCS